MIKAYNSESEDGEELWCPVLREYNFAAHRKAAHIFPKALGQDNMTIISGPEADNDLYSQRNGLILYGVLEEAFDQQKVVIVPSDAESSERPIQDWIVRVIDQDLLKKGVQQGRGCPAVAGS